MATDVLPTETGPSLTQLVSGIVADSQELFKQQWALLRHEVQDDFRKTKEAGAALVVGAVLAGVGGLLLSHLLVHLVAWAAPTWPLWVCYGVVGAPITAAGGLLLYTAFAKFKSLNPLPDQSAQAFKENMRWITNPK